MTTLSMMGRPVYVYATNKFTMQDLEKLVKDPALPTNIAVVGKSVNTVAISVYNKGMPSWLHLFKGTTMLVCMDKVLPEWFPQDARYIETIDFSYIELLMYMGDTGNIVLSDSDRRILVDHELILDVSRELGGLKDETT